MKDKKILAYMFKMRAHCIEIRSEVCKKLPFLPESYWNEADLSFFARCIRKASERGHFLKGPDEAGSKELGTAGLQDCREKKH